MQTNRLQRTASFFSSVFPFWLAASLTLGMTGSSCNPSDEGGTDTETANQAITSADQAASEASLLVPINAGLDPSQTPEDLASASAALADGMKPQDCASTQVTGAQVQWTFQNCTGPFGRARLDGTVTAAFRTGPRGTTADVSSSDLTIDDVPVEITATVLVKDSAQGQTLEVDGSLKAETSRFGEMTQTGAFTVTWEDATSCVSLGGTWNTGFGARTWKTTADNITSCPDSCLTGSLTFEGNSRTYNLTFSGNGEVSWSLASGRSGTVQTACGQ